MHFALTVTAGKMVVATAVFSFGLTLAGCIRPILRYPDVNEEAWEVGGHR